MKRQKYIDEIRECMKKRDDYMAMRLPRSFSNTIAEIYKEKEKNKEKVILENMEKCK